MGFLSEYFKERNKEECIENEYGFITYSIHNKICYIGEFYICPEFRRKGEGYKLADKVQDIAIKNQCEYLTSQADINAGGSAGAIVTILNYGFKIFKIEDGHIIKFFKEL